MDHKEAFDELAQEFKKSTNLKRISAEVKTIDQNIDRDKYVSMKECLSCGKVLGKQAAKKYFCHFCYGAVCAECSLLEVPHPETGKSERACNPCYLQFLKVKVLEISEEFVLVKMKEEIAEKEREIEKKKKISEEIRIVQTLMAEEKKKANAILNGKDEEIQKKEEKAEKMKKSNQTLRECIEEMIAQGRLSADEYKKVNPEYKPREVRSSECLKCEVF